MGKRKAKQAEAQEKPAEAQEKPKKKKRHGFRKLFFLVLVGAGAALALSEDLRGKALDALFGSEEEFQYSPPTPPSGDGANGASEAV